MTPLGWSFYRRTPVHWRRRRLAEHLARSPPRRRADHRAAGAAARGRGVPLRTQATCAGVLCDERSAVAAPAVQGPWFHPYDVP